MDVIEYLPILGGVVLGSFYLYVKLLLELGECFIDRREKDDPDTIQKVLKFTHLIRLRYIHEGRVKFSEVENDEDLLDIIHKNPEITRLPKCLQIIDHLQKTHDRARLFKSATPETESVTRFVLEDPEAENPKIQSILVIFNFTHYHRSTYILIEQIDQRLDRLKERGQRQHKEILAMIETLTFSSTLPRASHAALQAFESHLLALNQPEKS